MSTQAETQTEGAGYSGPPFQSGAASGGVAGGANPAAARLPAEPSPLRFDYGIVELSQHVQISNGSFRSAVDKAVGIAEDDGWNVITVRSVSDTASLTGFPVFIVTLVVTTVLPPYPNEEPF